MYEATNPDPKQPQGHRLLVQLDTPAETAREALVSIFGAAKGDAAVIVPGSREWVRGERTWKYSKTGCRAYIPDRRI